MPGIFLGYNSCTHHVYTTMYTCIHVTCTPRCPCTSAHSKIGSGSYINLEMYYIQSTLQDYNCTHTCGSHGCIYICYYMAEQKRNCTSFCLSANYIILGLLKSRPCLSSCHINYRNTLLFCVEVYRNIYNIL